MGMKEWMEMDIDQLELLDVTDIEKARVKQHVLKKRKKAPAWRNIAVTAIVIVGASTLTGFAFPSLASQIPFMDNVIQYFHNKEQHYRNFESTSTDIGLAQTSNRLTVMIDHAVYDGTNITISYAIETDQEFGESSEISAQEWFNVAGTNGLGGTDAITKISPTRYVGLSTITPYFNGKEQPEKAEISWTPQAFSGMENDKTVEGDWDFHFSLNRLEGDIQLVNETVLHKDISFTLQSVEFTDVSTVISYEQTVTNELLEKYPGVTPVFIVTDNLGHVYSNGESGGGVSPDEGKTFRGTTAFGAIQEGASQLIIQPVEIASLLSGNGHTEIELEPIVIKRK